MAVLSSLIWVLLSALGCGHVRQNFYPLGIYSVANTNDLVSVRAAGFNLVSGPANREFLKAAGAVGLKVLAPPGTSAGKQFDRAVARRTIARFDGHPALWAWYLVDEPDLNRISPEEVAQAQRFIKSLQPRKPTALVIYQGYDALYYGNITDLTMIDRYPIPWLPLENFGQQVAMTRLALGKKKPLLAVIQAFDWSYYPEHMPGEKNLRAPTYDEVRCMTYCALAQQANGLFYYAFDDGRWKMHEHPETWHALQKVIHEVNERLPLFQAEHLWWPLAHKYQDRSKRFNSALGSSITSVLLRVHRSNGRVATGDYILSVNNTEWTHAYQFALPRPVEGSLPVFAESRVVPVVDDWASDEFAPYAVHIYGPLPLARGP